MKNPDGAEAILLAAYEPEPIRGGGLIVWSARPGEATPRRAPAPYSVFAVSPPPRLLPIQAAMTVPVAPITAARMISTGSP